MSSQPLPAPANRLFRYLFEQASLGIAVEDLEGRILLANPALCSILGYTEQELRTMSCSEFANPEDSQDDWALFQQLRDGVIDHYSIEKRYIKKDGARIWGRLNVSLLKESDGGSPLVFAFVEEITERKLSGDELARSNERFRLAMEAGKTVAWEWDLTTGRDSWYGDLQTMFGIPSDTFVGRSEDFYRYVHPDDRQSVSKAVADARQTRKPYAAEFRVVRRDGIVRWVFATGKFYYGTSADAERMLGIATDITERKQVEEALRESNERFRLAAQAGKMYAYHWDAASDLVTQSEECANVLGLIDSGDHLTRQQLVARVHPDDRARFISAVEHLTPENPTLHLSYRFLRSDGAFTWVEKSGRAFFDTQGRLLRVMGMVADITERKQAEEALHQKDNELAEAQHLTGMGSWEWDARTDEMTWSKEVYLRVGRDPGLPAPRLREQASLFTAESWDRLQRAIEKAVQAGTPYELDLEIVSPESTVRWAITRGEPVRNADGQIIGLRGTVQDITDKKQAEQARRESEDKLRLLLDSTAEAIYGVDREHRCTFCNPACLRALGYERVDQVLGKNMHDLIHHTRADGTRFPVEECRVHRVTETGERVRAAEEVLWRANGTSFPAEYWSYPQRKENEVVGAVVAFIDITDRKLAEAAIANVSRKLIEAQEQERMRIGRELHDDIGQRLALLAVQLQQLRQHPLVLPGVRGRVSKLQKLITELASDTQSLSHELHSAKLQFLGIAAAMRGFCREFGEQQKVGVDFRAHDLPSTLSPDISLSLFRVLQEALHNSAKHSGVRHFEVRLWGTSDEIHLTVKDSGVGFDREAAKHSRGLGLISMEERLKMVNGTLSIESRPKRGATIHAHVPLRAQDDSMRAAG
ncbi:MAG TPA: PAS domain S-box protein [Terriglobales bacterium]|jgi:PAS domain S-box-containing protein|nr:PAS domain S-box protein [Terriglobales bacterium]